MSEYLNVAIELAKKAGQLQRERYLKAHVVERKLSTHLVTEVDKGCEKLIIEGIGSRYPDHDILGEEGTARRKASEFCWIVDPLDGTTNYSRQFPFFGVSIALEHKGNLMCGAIYDPLRDELFEAAKGAGARLNGRDISVSDTSKLKDAVLATGFAYVADEHEITKTVDDFKNFIKAALAVRRPGAAAIDLAYVACGRLDGFWELNLKPWDKAAGMLIIEEAGGKVTKFTGDQVDAHGDELLVSNGLVHDEMIQVLKCRSVGASESK